ncbi:tRNA-dihydrouridine(20a/20b) synthase [NAD(P)+]-like [Frankliniella fusca]|uniref:tRNA-dihydrouridine(20a/20b) synthase [NAD(P)+]-like n=1 Tax=Frankliniella fusca TaxID=407009 RepID=A0AAE1LBM6_9NEOP|nr:tRNA-dihydrouridine(20a/20b) synthase [NAD(P)+]-like [Frankliniella fusca]
MVNADILDLFQEKDFLRICAPMVRYSKLPFRILAKRNGCDLCYSPMIMADSFVQSAKARRNEFTTCTEDSPLIVQFAANSVSDFVNAAEIVVPFSNGVDLNCGCPQRWAMKEGYGAHLLTKPEIIHDMVRQVRNRVPEHYSVSVKIRLLEEDRKTIELARSLEFAGVTFLTLHARTTQERHSPIHEDSLREVCQSLKVPLVANGDVKSLKGAERLHAETGCKGMMAARGMLSNPAMFRGYPTTPLTCVQDWINISLDLETIFNCFHHHLVFMMEHIMPKEERRIFNSLKTKSAVLEFLEKNYGITYEPGKSGLSSANDIIICDKSSVREEMSAGAFFETTVQKDESYDDTLDSLGGLYN